ncbi:hypothetical protein BH23PAT1_BH23PAT1_3940 [soil metagenome]
MRYIIGVIIVVLALFFILIALINRGGNDEQGERAVDLTDYANRAAQVEYTQYGRVVAQEDRRAVRISVSRTERVIEVLHGYEERVERREVFENIESAYSEFIMALHRAGYATEREASEDERGFCPTGKRYTYQLVNDTSRVFDNWSTSCSRAQGSFAGEAGLVRRLFENQIPEYSTITRGVRL